MSNVCAAMAVPTTTAAESLLPRAERVVRHQNVYTPPIVIAARMRPEYPKELFCDPDTAATVDRRWAEYFPAGGVEMGDSGRGHLD